MRKQKDRCIVADAAGDTETFTAASIKLRRQKDIYEDFCKAAGTYTEYERTFVAGHNRHLAGKTGAITRAQNKLKNAQITLTDLENGGIINKRVPLDEVNKTIRVGMQQKHILGSAEWLNESKKAIAKGKSPKSALYKNIDPQELIDEFSGKGIVRYTKKSEFPEEFVDAGKIVGVVYDKKAGKYIPSSRIQIIHSRKGAHVFPVIDNGGEKK